MTDAPARGLGLAEFLADLGEELQRAQEQGSKRVRGLRLGVEELTVVLEVAHERTLSGELAGKVGGKFWVFGSAEASGNVGHEVTRSRTQTLTLTLRPRVEITSTDAQGRQETTHSGLNVTGAVGAAEQQPPPAAPVSGAAREPSP